MSKLPFIISIPHGGTSIPKEVKDNSQIGPRGIFEDSDAFTQEIFDLKDNVEAVVKADIARAYIDVNRHESMVPPEYPDGVIKTITCYEKTIYKDGFFPDNSLFNDLLDKHYYPYHQKIERTVRRREIVFGFDCHSMAETGPPIAQDAGQKRPMVCISNNSGQACDNRITRILAQCFQQYFGVDAGTVMINKPFNGGYITSEYGYNPIPWLQIEINRSLYLHPNWFNSKTLTIDNKRLESLNHLFHRTLVEFSKQI